MSGEWIDPESSPNDPWSSREVDKVYIRDAIRNGILAWMSRRAIRACGERCPYAADFEISEAMRDIGFDEKYESQIRRHTRTLRREGKILTVTKRTHKHHNILTNQWAQCHRLPAEVIPFPQRKHYIRRHGLIDPETEAGAPRIRYIRRQRLQG